MTVVCIAGMHRSGTSLVARALNLSGLYLGPESDISATAPDNPEGFWENIHFLRLNDEILAKLGGAWDMPPTLRPGWELRPDMFPYRARAIRIIEQFNGREPWGWKDPRNSLTIGFWKNILPNQKVVICIRNPLEVVQSLSRRGYSSPVFGFNLWLAYNKHLLETISPERRIVTHFDAYFRNPRAELERILEFLHIPASEEQIAAALASITLPLRHNHVALLDILDYKPPFELLKLYQDMCLQAGAVYQTVAGSDPVVPNISASDYRKYLQNREKERLTERLAEKEQAVQTLTRQVAEKEQAVVALTAQVAEKEQAVQTLTRQVAEIKSSKAWLVTRILRRIRVFFTPHQSKREYVSRIQSKLASLSARKEQYARLIDHGLWVLRNQGFRVFIAKVSKKALSKTYNAVGRKTDKVISDVQLNTDRKCDYPQWIKDNEPNSFALERQRQDAKRFVYQPKISIIVPVFNPPVEFLTDLINSIRAQTYENWELCISNGSPENSRILNLLTKWAASDSRIRHVNLHENLGISENSNQALHIAQGEYSALVDHDDALAPFALYEVAACLQENPHLDLIYSDHDYLSADGGKRLYPLFKPDWSPEVMLSTNYITHLTVIRTEFIRQVGGFQSSMDGAQDWDLFFRVVEKTQHIAHIPKVLYHWRESSNSTANNINAKPYASAAQIRAICRHLNSLGLQDAAAFFDPSGGIRVKWSAPAKKVSIIILARGANDLLKNCINSILQRTKYSNFEILIVNNGPKRPDEFGYFQEISKKPVVKIIHFDGEFNYSRVNNYGVRHCDGDYLLFLNDDTEVISDHWLDELAMWASQPQIGAVGAKLLRPNGLIQHAGVIIGLGGFARHIFADAAEPLGGIFGTTEWYRNYSALTAACLMVRRDVFEEVGGFDEEFILNGSDVEFGMRLIKSGFRLVYNPFVRLKHIESATHQGKIPPGDFTTSIIHYKKYLQTGDPYFSPNLSYWNTIPTYKRKSEEDPFQFARDYMERVSLENKHPQDIKATDYSREATGIAGWFDATHAELNASKEIHQTFPGELDIKSVSWFIPGFHNPYYGGIYTILKFANFLRAQKGIKNHFLLVGSTNERKIEDHIASAFPDLRGSPVKSVMIDDRWERFDATDAVVATLWSTAYYALKFNRTKRKFYFVQDYEPLFYPAGSAFGQAEATYRFGFYGLANTPTLKDIYEQQYSGVAECFLPNVDTNIFFLDPARKFSRHQRRYTLFFYGRPEHPRNGFELGIAAIKKLKEKLGDSLTVFSAGAEWSPKAYGSEGVITNLGLLTLKQTAALYRDCDAGLAMMFTKHPSYLPFEFMASGCLVVTNRNSATQWLLEDGENCLLTEATPSCIAETLERGLVCVEEREHIVRNAAAMITSRFSNWDAQMERIFRFMCNLQK